MLRAYAAAHVRVTTEGDAPWAASVTSVEGHASNDGPRARFRIALHAPRDEASRSVRIHADIVAHEVVSHYTMVYVRSDWAAGAAHREPQLVGTIHAGHDDVRVARGGSFWRGLRSIAGLGIEHIATGTDHLLFLFMLVLAAPLVAARGRWRGVRATRDMLGRLARIVTAFTLGHSLTLAAQTLGAFDLRASVVEPLIALSILATAVHVLRPLFPRADVAFAGGFGLVHGLAFASTLAGRDLGAAQTAWTLLGFNIGIEVAQLGILALVVPWVLLLARTPWYRGFRVAGASAGLTLACAWLFERIAGRPNPLGVIVTTLERHPIVLLACLAALALIARRRSSALEAAATP